MPYQNNHPTNGGASDKLCPHLDPVLPGGRRHGHFPQMWHFKKIMAVCGGREGV
jgi:hypothetical protein